MTRIRLSTTVDAELLDSARGLQVGSTDAALVDEALRALLVRHRSAEVDASYTVYDEHPVDEPDAVGRLGVVATGGRCLVSDLPSRGEVWWCEMAEIGRRPVIVLSRDAVIPRHRRALVAPCTTTVRVLASEVVLEPSVDPVPLRSAVNLDSVESVSISLLVQRLGRLADFRMREICGALAIAVDCS